MRILATSHDPKKSYCVNGHLMELSHFWPTVRLAFTSDYVTGVRNKQSHIKTPLKCKDPKVRLGTNLNEIMPIQGFCSRYAGGHCLIHKKKTFTKNFTFMGISRTTKTALGNFTSL